MKQRSIGFKIGVVLSALHLSLVMLAFVLMLNSRSSTSGLIFIWFFFLDAPLLLLLPTSALRLFGVAAPLIQFGVFGSALWFSIPWLIDRAVTRVFPNGTRTVRVIIIAGVVPFLLAGFYRLSFFSTKLLVQQERPAELKKVLNQASSDFLTGKVVFEDDTLGGVSSINRMTCRPDTGMELLLGLSRSVVFLNESYQEQYRLNLSDRNGFRSIEPLVVDGAHSCGFLAYMFQEGVSLFDLNGKETEIWKRAQVVTGAGAIDGVCFGDIDGDGKPEFAIYHSYREGIHLIDGGGKTRWTHPVYALGHLEFADVRGEGKAEVIYANSNNASGITEFTVLDSDGAVANQRSITTTSYEFAVVRWPNREARPNILLTEDGKIRLVDLPGDRPGMQLDAPGCRAFGEVKAVTVKFDKEKPEYLAVRKRLHPDLSVLYVYDADGKLVYQKTDVIEGGHTPALVAVPANETGGEKLLVGAKRNFRAQVLEYSLTR